MGELDDSLTFALGAGQSFDLSEDSEYVTTIICKFKAKKRERGEQFILVFDINLCIFSYVAKCIDKYINIRAASAMSEKIDPRLEDIVERMFQRCAEDCEYEQAIGIALESRRLDVVKSIIQKGDASKLLTYVLDVCMTLVQNLEFRNEVLRLLVDLYETLKNPDYISISQCLVHLNDTTACANMLKSLVEKNDEVKKKKNY